MPSLFQPSPIQLRPHCPSPIQLVTDRQTDGQTRRRRRDRAMHSVARVKSRKIHVREAAFEGTNRTEVDSAMAVCYRHYLLFHKRNLRTLQKLSFCVTCNILEI